MFHSCGSQPVRRCLGTCLLSQLEGLLFTSGRQRPEVLLNTLQKHTMASCVITTKRHLAQKGNGEKPSSLEPEAVQWWLWAAGGLGNDLQRSKYKGTSGRDGNAHYLNCGGGLMNVDNCQTSTCTLKMGVK